MKISRELIKEEASKARQIILEIKKPLSKKTIAEEIKIVQEAILEVPQQKKTARLIVREEIKKAYDMIMEASGFHVFSVQDDEETPAVNKRKGPKRSKSDGGIIGFSTQHNKGVDEPTMEPRNALFHEGDLVKWKDNYINAEGNKVERERTGTIVAIKGNAFPVAKVKVVGRGNKEKFYFPTLSMVAKVAS